MVGIISCACDFQKARDNNECDSTFTRLSKRTIAFTSSIRLFALGKQSALTMGWSCLFGIRCTADKLKNWAFCVSRTINVHETHLLGLKKRTQRMLFSLLRNITASLLLFSCHSWRAVGNTVESKMALLCLIFLLSLGELKR